MFRQKQTRRGGLAAAAFACALALVGGCSSPATTSSDKEATVHGTVAVKGARAARGRVLFNPANINRKAASTAFDKSMAIVMGPRPPGTGVIQPARAAAAS